MSALFRREVLAQRRDAWLGPVLLLRPPSLGWLSLLAAASAIAVGAFLATGQASRKVHVTGVLTPDRGVMRLLPPQAGVVLESRAVEGQAVAAGEPLFVLSVEQTSTRGDTQAAVQASLAARERSLQSAGRQRSGLIAQQAASIERQLADLRRELAQLDAQADLHRQRLALARAAQDRLAALQADNFVSPAQLQAKAEELLALQAQGQTIDRQHAALARELAVLEAQRAELPLRAQAAAGEIERDLALLAQQSAESVGRQRIVVKAPMAGIVSAVLAEPGHSVAPGTALASLLPVNAQGGAKLQAHLYAPSSAVGFLRAGQPVLLRYQAFPYQKFGHHSGQVLQVARTPLQTAELAALPLWTAPATSTQATAAGVASFSEPLYRVTVALDAQSVQAFGSAQPLAAGMQLDADVLLERRRLVEWIFEPLFSLSGRL